MSLVAVELTIHLLQIYRYISIKLYVNVYFFSKERYGMQEKERIMVVRNI